MVLGCPFLQGSPTSIIFCSFVYMRGRVTLPPINGVDFQALLSTMNAAIQATPDFIGKKAFVTAIFM